MKKKILMFGLLVALAFQVPAQAGFFSYSSLFMGKAFQAISKKVVERPSLAIPLTIGIIFTGWVIKQAVSFDPSRIKNPTLRVVRNVDGTLSLVGFNYPMWCSGVGVNHWFVKITNIEESETGLSVQNISFNSVSADVNVKKAWEDFIKNYYDGKVKLTFNKAWVEIG